jgi:hypothetical protein
MTAESAQANRTVAPGSATELPVLRACLKAARKRACAALVLRGAVLGAVAALALLCGLELFALLSERGITFASAAPLGWPLSIQALCLATFVGVLVLAIVLGFVFAPDTATLARAAERTFALQERLSTALEVDGARKPDTSHDPIRGALLADAEQHAAGIDPRQIVRFGWPRAGFAIPVLVAAAILLQLMPPEAIGFGALRGRAPNLAPVGLTAQQSAAAAANLRRIAELLVKDADETSDQYLRSIARSLDRLSADVERAAIDRQELTHRLESLVAHARQAYGNGNSTESRPATGDVSRQLEAALSDIAGNRATATADARAGEDAPRADKAVSSVTERAPPAGQLQRRTTSVQPPAELAPSDRLKAGRDALKDLDDYDVLDPRVDKERAFAEQQRRVRATAQSVGAARDAGQGDGERAGEGTRPIGNGATALNELASGAQMLLPDQAPGDGRHIRIELPPEASLSKVAPPPSEGNGAWRRAQEQAVEREALAPADRKVVERYFARPTGNRGP